MRDQWKERVLKWELGDRLGIGDLKFVMRGEILLKCLVKSVKQYASDFKYFFSIFFLLY